MSAPLDDPPRSTTSSPVDDGARILDASTDAGRTRVAAVGIAVESAFVHCAAALRRAGLFDPESWGRIDAPTTGKVVTGHLALTESGVAFR